MFKISCIDLQSVSQESFRSNVITEESRERYRSCAWWELYRELELISNIDYRDSPSEVGAMPCTLQSTI